MNRSLFTSFQTLIETNANTPLFTFLDGKGNAQNSLTAAQLDTRARRIARYLRDDAGLQRGERVLLVYPPSLDFVEALLGCLAAELIPVPIAPPNPLRPEKSFGNFASIAADCQASAILTNRAYFWSRRLGNLRSKRLAYWSDLPWHRTDNLGRQHALMARYPTPNADDLALLQYTSGSTAAPKGVMLSHGNLQHQIALNQTALHLNHASVSVLWVPHFHDFGLISGILSSLFGSGHLILMSPMTFLQRPAAWLAAMSHYRATHTAAPNFAYDLAVSRTDPTERAAWDLSHLRVVMSAAEPIRPKTVNRFFDAFAISGLRRTAFCPAYGLAEHTVGVTLNGTKRLTVSRITLEHNNRLQITPAHTMLSTTLISCGSPPADVELHIVEPATGLSLPDTHIGEIWVDSPSKGLGYWGRPAKSAEQFAARLATQDSGHPDEQSDGRGFLRTGDLGAMVDGELYITGRLKELMIVRGRNIYPQDVEEIVTHSDRAVKPGRVAAFGVPNTDACGESIVVVAELRSHPSADVLHHVGQQIRAALQAHQLPVGPILLTNERVIEKTTSGKLQRTKLRQAYLTGALHPHILFADRDTQPASAKAAPVAAVAPGPMQVVTLDSAEQVAAWLQLRLAQLLQRTPSDIGPAAVIADLGLDSLASTSVMGELSTQLGKRLPVSLLAGNVTIGTLAQLAHTFTPLDQAANSADSSTWLPVTAAQDWIFGRDLPDIHYWNIGKMLEIGLPINFALLQQAVTQLVGQHDALRVQFRQHENRWQQRVGRPPADLPLHQVSLAHEAADTQTALIESIANAFQSSLNIEHGPIFRVVHFDLGANQPSRLLMIVHHLVCDAYGLQILLKELLHNYQVLAQGQTPPTLASRITYAEFGRMLAELPQTLDAPTACGRWLNLLDGPAQSLPFDNPHRSNRSKTQVHHWVTLDEQISAQLLRTLPARFQTTSDTILLTAVVEAYCAWTGHDSLYCDTQHHGRTHTSYGANDLTNTVCWSNTIYPMRLHRSISEMPREQLCAMIAQRAGYPHNGLSYGLLRMGNAAARQQLDALPKPLFKFLYHGQLLNPKGASMPGVRVADESAGQSYHPEAKDGHSLYCYGFVIDRQIRFDIAYNSERFEAATIVAFGELLHEKTVALVNGIIDA